jgi:hypothetical protein
MDAATINARIYVGRAKAAQRIGYAFTIYRPLTAAAPLGNAVGTINAAFNAADNTYAKPNGYGRPIWFADLDGRVVRPGDYLINTTNAADVYFIAGMQSLLPIIAIDCPRRVRITGAPVVASAGNVGYFGVCDGETSDVLGTASAPWPAAINLGKGGGMVPDALPSGSRRNVGWEILLPPSVPITIHAGMHVTDDIGQRFTVDGAELTDLGWRLNCSEAHA